jgi:hypothetical protein
MRWQDELKSSHYLRKLLGYAPAFLVSDGARGYHGAVISIDNGITVGWYNGAPATRAHHTPPGVARSFLDAVMPGKVRDRIKRLALGLRSSFVLRPSMIKALIASLISSSLANSSGKSQSLKMTHDNSAANEMRARSLG